MCLGVIGVGGDGHRLERHGGFSGELCAAYCMRDAIVIAASAGNMEKGRNLAPVVGMNSRHNGFFANMLS